MSQDVGGKYLNNGTDFVPTQHHDTYPAIDPTKVDLSGRTVLITGASKGVGKAAAISFAQAGASGIALAARSSLESTASAVKEAAKKAGRPEPNVLSIKLDVTDPQSVEAAAEEVKAGFNGELDILINNAGYLSNWKTIVESDPNEWSKDWDVNIKGTYLVSRSMIPLLLKSTLKIVVNVSSTGAHVVAPGASGYQASKLALCRLTEFFNADHGAQGLLAYSIHPGGVKTELAGGMPEEWQKRVLVDEPELPADMLVWLTKERREWLAGRYFNVRWDVDEIEKRIDDIVKGDLLKVRLAVNTFS